MHFLECAAFALCPHWRVPLALYPRARSPAPPSPIRRRLTQAAFTPAAVRGYLPLVQASAEAAVRKWEAQGDIK